MSTDAILKQSETYSDFDCASDQSEPKWTERQTRLVRQNNASKSDLMYGLQN